MTVADLLQHALEDSCHDPDCEVHNIDVALQEQVVGALEATFFLAGAQAYRDAVERARELGDLEPEEHAMTTIREWVKGGAS